MHLSVLTPFLRRCPVDGLWKSTWRESVHSGPAGGCSASRRSKNAESQGRLPHANVNISESTSEKAHIII